MNLRARGILNPGKRGSIWYLRLSTKWGGFASKVKQINRTFLAHHHHEKIYLRCSFKSCICQLNNRAS